MNLNFKGTRLLVYNYESCIEFYQKILGFELTYQNDSEDEIDLKMGDIRLNLIKRQSMANIIGSSGKLSLENPPDNLALIFTTQNLEDTCVKLKEHNVTFITKPTYRPEWGIKTVYLRDPDHNLIGIYEMIDQSSV